MSTRHSMECGIRCFPIQNCRRSRRRKEGFCQQLLRYTIHWGFAAPVILLAKSLLQKLWRTKEEWDEQLADGELEHWRQWKSDLSALAKVKIPRSYKSNIAKSSQTSHNDTRKCAKEIQLHNFSDASEIGYGAASYIRTEFTDGQVMCALVFGKSRTAPLRKVSIPRLELQAAILSVRVSELVQREIDMHVI